MERKGEGNMEGILSSSRHEEVSVLQLVHWKHTFKEIIGIRWSSK